MLYYLVSSIINAFFIILIVDFVLMGFFSFRFSLKSKKTEFVITRENLNFYNNELLDNSKELLQASIKGLANKELDLTAFLVSKKTYFDLMLEYQQALADYYISYAELVCEMNIIEIEKEFI